MRQSLSCLHWCWRWLPGWRQSPPWVQPAALQPGPGPGRWSKHRGQRRGTTPESLCCLTYESELLDLIRDEFVATNLQSIRKECLKSAEGTNNRIISCAFYERQTNVSPLERGTNRES